VDVIVQALGPQQALEELVQAMERSNAQDLLGYVIRMHDLGSSDEVEDEDEDSNPEDDYNWVGHKSHYNRKDEVKKESLDSIRDLIQQELKNL
jgi:hypothetical protein